MAPQRRDNQRKKAGTPIYKQFFNKLTFVETLFLLAKQKWKDSRKNISPKKNVFDLLRQLK